MSVDFIDSNIFVYLFDTSDAEKQQTAQGLVRDAIANGTGSISFQVVQETLNVLTRRFATPARPEDARRFLNEVLAPLWRVMPSEALYEHALQVHGRYGYGFYDSLIIAGALSSGCTRLLSEDLRDGQRIGPLIIENPFATVPGP